MIAIAALVVAVALAVTAVTAILVFPLLSRAGIVDVPSHRSSHTRATVRGGGVAIGAGITAATIVTIVWMFAEYGIFGAGAILMPLAFLVVTWCYSAIGMSDDLDSLQAVGRLIGQAVIALAFSAGVAMFSTHGLAHVIAIAIIGVGLVNAVNFVDGLNGFVCMWAVVVGAWYALVAIENQLFDIMFIALALAGAAAGFLPFNLGRARAFLGDTGSYGLGAAVFALATWLFVSDVPIVVIVAPLIFVLFDVGLTLVWRLFQGENILRPHRTHIYQRIQQAGWSHERVSLLHTCLAVLACVLAMPTLVAGNTPMTLPTHILWFLLVGFYAALPVLLTRRNRAEVLV